VTDRAGGPTPPNPLRQNHKGSLARGLPVTRRMWLPNPIYRALPGAYTLSGMAVLWAAPMPASLVSGGLLLGAGFAVWQLRQQARRRPPYAKALSGRKVSRPRR